LQKRTKNGTLFNERKKTPEKELDTALRRMKELEQ